MLNSIKRKHHFGDKRFAKHFLFTIKCHVWQPFFRLKLTHIYLICCCCCCCFSAAFFLVRFFFSLFVCIDGVSALFGTLNTRQHTPLPMTAFNKYCQFDLTLSVHEVSKIHTTTRRGNKNRTNERIEKILQILRWIRCLVLTIQLASDLFVARLLIFQYFLVWYLRLFEYECTTKTNFIHFFFSFSHFALFFFYLLWSMHLTELVHPIRHSDHSQNY